MVESIARRRPELRERLGRTRQLMCDAVPDCLVTGWEPLVAALQLPDPDDRHVLAAAIRSHAGVIVTYNTHDFPDVKLEPFGIVAQHPDTFLMDLLELAPARSGPGLAGAGRSADRPASSTARPSRASPRHASPCAVQHGRRGAPLVDVSCRVPTLWSDSLRWTRPKLQVPCIFGGSLDPPSTSSWRVARRRHRSTGTISTPLDHARPHAVVDRMAGLAW